MIDSTCHSERSEESHTRNGIKPCSKARCFAALSMTVLKSVKLSIDYLLLMIESELSHLYVRANARDFPTIPQPNITTLQFVEKYYVLYKKTSTHTVKKERPQAQDTRFKTDD